MPIRKEPLITSQIYHIVNRGISSQLIFNNKSDYDRAISTMFYYQDKNYPIRYSHNPRLKNQPFRTIVPLVEIFAFCLMPNHYHILVKQLEENGISTFIQRFTNSFAKYANTKYNRFGPLFQGRFKAILIETDNQLLHVSRYIHLNPYSSYIVRSKEEVLTYPYSSIKSYLNPNQPTQISTKEILSHFSKTQTYKDFLLDQADYQQTLDRLKHLTLE